MAEDGVGQTGRFEIHAHHSEPAVFPEEAHDTVQVCIPLAGAMFSVRRVSETGRGIVHELSARDILIVPAGQPHAVSWRRPAGVVSLHLSERFLADVAGGPVRLADAATLRDSFVSAAADQLSRELAAGRVSAAPFIEAVVTAIAWRVAAGGEAAAPAPGPTSPLLSGRQIARIEAFIDENIDAPVRVHELASVLRLSPSHFARRFGATLGISPYEFVVRKRLQRARLLLVGTDLAITQIALEAGMTHSHFSRTFRREFGLSPREFRQANRA
jgi:AraC family transcriptional regulator